MDGKEAPDMEREYRKLLINISRDTDEKTLLEMISYCNVKKGIAEKFNDALQLFDYLEERGRLSSTNVKYLMVMLEDLEKTTAQEKVANYEKKNVLSSNGTAKVGRNLTDKVISQAADDDVDACSLTELDDACLYMKERLGRQWRDFARELGLTQVDIDAIEEKYSRDLKEQSYQALVEWKKKQKGSANVEKLIKHLRNKRLNQIANDIQEGKYLKKSC